jgi:hypothetical protein
LALIARNIEVMRKEKIRRFFLKMLMSKYGEEGKLISILGLLFIKPK